MEVQRRGPTKRERTADAVRSNTRHELSLAILRLQPGEKMIG